VGPLLVPVDLQVCFLHGIHAAISIRQQGVDPVLVVVAAARYLHVEALVIRGALVATALVLGDGKKRI